MNREALRRVAQAGKDSDPGWYTVHRKLSIHLSPPLFRAGVTANQVSGAMMLLGLAGAAMLVPESPAWNLAGFGVLYLTFLLDKVDGEIARLSGTSSGRGILLDRFHHRFVEPMVFVAAGFHAFRHFDAPLALAAGFATMVFGNMVEEHQQVTAYIHLKRVREGAVVPEVPVRRASPGMVRARALFRPLKVFRTAITVYPLLLLCYLAQQLTGRPIVTIELVVGAVALAIYALFQCIDYFMARLDEETAAIATLFRRAGERGHTVPHADGHRPETIVVPPPAAARTLQEVRRVTVTRIIEPGLSA
jgi:phosphatidylglycerophosphate synthase